MRISTPVVAAVAALAALAIAVPTVIADRDSDDASSSIDDAADRPTASDGPGTDDPAQPPTARRGVEIRRYVAIGDSFVSGPGIAPVKDAACGRSAKNFPELVAASLDVETLVDVSCSGATTRDLTQAQGANPPQLEAITPDTDLVTFGTLGGNDLGLVPLAAACAGYDDCVPTGADPYRAQIEASTKRLRAGVRTALRTAPEATIFLVGYGTYLPPGGCTPPLLGLTGAEADYVQGLLDQLSDATARLAEREGVGFIDLREIPGAVERTACAAPADQWIRALSGFGDGAPLHPSSCGMEAMAQHVARAVRTARGESAAAFDPSCVRG